MVCSGFLSAATKNLEELLDNSKEKVIACFTDGDTGYSGPTAVMTRAEVDRRNKIIEDRGLEDAGWWRVLRPLKIPPKGGVMLGG